jgi:hypothetical protein
VTVATLITHALQRLGVVAGGETPAAEDSELALARLNALVDSWRTMALFGYTQVRTTFTITANVADYAVGVGATVNVARPVFVDDINILDTAQNPDLEIDLGPLMSDADYADIPQKALTAPYPQVALYAATLPTGTITFWPVPTLSSLQGAIYTPNTSGTLALTDTLSVPPGYQLFYETALAVEMAPDFERDPSPVLVRSAQRAEDRIKMVNVVVPRMQGDPALVGTTASRWHINTDQ